MKNHCSNIRIYHIEDMSPGFGEHVSTVCNLANFDYS